MSSAEEHVLNFRCVALFDSRSCTVQQAAKAVFNVQNSTDLTNKLLKRCFSR
jgi:cysteinyl-tRNA synthetase